MTDQPISTAAAAPTATSTAQKVYQPDVAATLELVGIDDQPLYNDDNTPMTIDLIGADSDVAIAARNSQSNRRLAAGARLKLTQEGLAADGAAYLAKLVTGWNITPSKLIPGIDPGLGEGRVPFSTAAATSLFKNPKFEAIKEQPDRFVADRTHFLRTSPTA